MSRLSVAFFALAIPALLACSGLGGGKAAECNNFINTVNAALPNIQKISAENPGSDLQKVVDQMKRIGDEYEKLHTSLQAVTITDAELKTKTDEYVRMTKAMTNTARQAATGAAHLDMRMINRVQKQMSDLTRDESRLVNDINSYCSGK